MNNKEDNFKEQREKKDKINRKEKQVWNPKSNKKQGAIMVETNNQFEALDNNEEENNDIENLNKDKEDNVLITKEWVSANFQKKKDGKSKESQH